MKDNVVRIFKALSSRTRIRILRMLFKKSYSITELSKLLKKSKVTISKHVKIMEDAGIVRRKILGKKHVLEINRDKLYEIFSIFNNKYNVKAKHGETVYDVLKRISREIKVRKRNDSIFVYSIDNDEGNFIYEIDNNLPMLPMNKFVIKKDVKIVIKKLVPIKLKEINVKV